MMANGRVRVGFRPVVWTSSGLNPFDVQLGMAEEAEALGFDAIFAADRMLASVGYTGGMIYESTTTEIFVTLSAVAARTSRIHLGPLVLVVPFRNPVQLAKLTASLDLLSKGRLILPVGQGWNQTEFNVLGVPKSEAAGRMEESIAILRRLWSGEPVSCQGRYFQFEDIRVEPKPHRPGGPPIWLGSFAPPDMEFWQGKTINARLDRVLNRVGRVAEGWVPLTYSTRTRASLEPGLLKEAWDRVQRSAAEAGRPPGSVEFVYSHWYYIVETKQDEEAARRDIGYFFPGSFEEAKETYLIGTPREIAAKVRRLTQQIEQVDWYIFTALGPSVEQVRRLRADVVPLLEGGR